MVKRKRSEDSLEERLERHKTDLFRALKKVKGFERQRLSRRVNEKGLAPENKEKFELQIAVLKVCIPRALSISSPRASARGT